MCDPITIAASLAATMAGGQGIMMFDQKKMTEEQLKQQAGEIQRANNMAVTSYLEDSSQLNYQQMQEDEQASQERFVSKLQTQKAVAAARTAQAESGLTGISLNEQVGDLIRQGSMNLATIDTNQGYSRQQRAYNKKGLQRQAEGRTQDFKPILPSKFGSLLGAGLQIGGTALSTYGAAKSAGIGAKGGAKGG